LLAVEVLGIIRRSYRINRSARPRNHRSWSNANEKRKVVPGLPFLRFHVHFEINEVLLAFGIVVFE
jgi:hypothetical protein